MSKILVIDDYEEFKDTILRLCHLNLVCGELEKHELPGDVIEFKAEVMTANEELKKPLLVFSPGTKLEDEFAEHDEVIVFAVKKAVKGTETKEKK